VFARHEEATASIPATVPVGRNMMRGRVVSVDDHAGLNAGFRPGVSDVVLLIARGCRYKEIAARLQLAVKTVEAHVSNVLRKLQLSNRHELTRWAAASFETRIRAHVGRSAYRGARADRRAAGEARS
jgi:hypothetical protein